MFSIKKYFVAVALLIASMIGAVQVQAAGQSVQDVIDETYVQPQYVLGYSLSDEQRLQTLALLNYNESKEPTSKPFQQAPMPKL